MLYEDSKIGKEFPLHHLLLRMVEDDINGQAWRLRKAVFDNPRNGIDKVLADVRVASLIAGAGMLFVLADRDVLIEHVNQNAKPGEARLLPTAADADVVAAVRATADAPDRVRVFLLQPNLEGLIRAIETCAPGQWSDDMRRAKAKDRLARDFVLTEVAKAAMAAVRACIRTHQPGLEALAKALAEVLPEATIA
ncbi:MAG: hypothetical protein EXR71_20965 [Myxococcales bacterium]|nr:hypothetical protein [Myxococcales bacterium]